LIQKKLVDMAVSFDAGRFLTYRAAWLLDRGRSVTKESAMAKLFASEAAVQIANEALQIHGGYGFIKDYPVEKFYRDIKLCTSAKAQARSRRSSSRVDCFHPRINSRWRALDRRFISTALHT
jgi:alkylation response protein AidB-like acyl-CoA dehydrogenase